METVGGDTRIDWHDSDSDSDSGDIENEIFLEGDSNYRRRVTL